MAKQPVPAVEPSVVGAQKPLHARDQVRFGRFDHRVEMVAHQAPGMDLPIRFLARLAKGVEERLAIRVTAKNILGAVAAAHHMVNRADKLET